MNNTSKAANDSPVSTYSKYTTFENISIVSSYFRGEYWSPLSKRDAQKFIEGAVDNGTIESLMELIESLK
jgi:hypothetical protein